MVGMGPMTNNKDYLSELANTIQIYGLGIFLWVGMKIVNDWDFAMFLISIIVLGTAIILKIGSLKYPTMREFTLYHVIFSMISMGLIVTVAYAIGALIMVGLNAMVVT